MSLTFKSLFAPAIMTAGLVTASPVFGQQQPGFGYQGMMTWPMMLVCGAVALLALTLIVLGIAALLKYLRK